MPKLFSNWRHAGPWLGIATAPATLMLGGGVAQQVAPAEVGGAIVLGATVLWALSSAQGRLGAARGQPLVALARPVLGAGVARWTNTALMAALMSGWAAFGTGVAGGSLAHLLGLPEVVAFVAWAALMVLGLWGGIVRGSLIALLGSLATLVLMGWGTLQAQGAPAAPPEALGGESLFAGMSLVIGYGAAFSLRCPDFTQQVRCVRVAWISLFGLALPLALVAWAGAWLYQAAGTWDLSLLLSALGFPVLAHVFVVVGFLGAGLSNMHSGSLAIQDLLGWPREGALLALGAISVGLALADFEQGMVAWLQFLSVVVVPLIGVIVTHYGLRRASESTVHWSGILAWTLGAVAGLATPPGWPGALVGVAVAAAAYALLARGPLWRRSLTGAPR